MVHAEPQIMLNPKSRYMLLDFLSKTTTFGFVREMSESVLSMDNSSNCSFKEDGTFNTVHSLILGEILTLIFVCLINWRKVNYCDHR